MPITFLAPEVATGDYLTLCVAWPSVFQKSIPIGYVLFWFVFFSLSRKDAYLSSASMGEA